MSSLVGKKLGKFQLVEQMGRSHFATLYKSYDSTSDRYVVVEVFHTAGWDHAEHISQVMLNVSRLHHPHIVPIYDGGYEGGRAHLVMEYVPGGSLKDRLEHSYQRLPLSDTLSLILQACQALEFAQRSHILHQDLTPSKMLLRSEDFLLLSGFGNASILQELMEGEDVLEGDYPFTPQYMAPEQVSGSRVDQRSDLYSLGIITYQAVTGRVPFDGDGLLNIFIKQVNEPLPPPSQFVPDLPPMVERLIVKALAKNPDQRYQSAAEMIVDLESITLALAPRARARAADRQAAPVIPPPPEAKPQPAKAPAPPPAAPASPVASEPAPKVDKPKVFVSHSHKNDEFTARFVADLRAAGAEVWVDMTNIQYGDFMTRINEALSTCEWLVLVLTPDALASPAVQMEVNAAITMSLQKEINAVIPFMALPCDPKSIPPTWKNLHRYDGTSDYTIALAGLLRALGLAGN